MPSLFERLHFLNEWKEHLTPDERAELQALNLILEEHVVLPRSVVAALVDPDDAGYIRVLWLSELLECGYCKQHADYVNMIQHATDCPIRVLQEALVTQ